MVGKWMSDMNSNILRDDHCWKGTLFCNFPLLIFRLNQTITVKLEAFAYFVSDPNLYNKDQLRWIITWTAFYFV